MAMMREKKKEMRVRGIVIKSPGLSIFQNESITNENILLSITEILHQRKGLSNRWKYLPLFKTP